MNNAKTWWIKMTKIANKQERKQNLAEVTRYYCHYCDRHLDKSEVFGHIGFDHKVYRSMVD